MNTHVQEAVQSWRESQISLIGSAGLLIAIAVWLWQLPHFLAGNSVVWPQYATAFYDMLFYTAWGFAVLVLVTALTRTVSLKLLFAFWLFGVFAVHGVVIALETPFRGTLGVTGVGIWIAPVVETVVVLLVVLLFYVLATHRRGSHPSVTDGMLVGFATGAGLGFHEEMTYGRLVPIGPGAEYGSVGNTGQDIWWSYVFPLVGWQGTLNIRQFGNGLTGNFTLYHAGWGTLLGIALGLIYIHRHNVLAWIAGLFAIAVTYFEHLSGNWRVSTPLEPAPIVGDLFQAGDVYGATELAVYILLVAITSAILTDFVVIRRLAGQLDAFPSVGSKLLSESERSTSSNATVRSGFGAIYRLRALGEYARFRRALAIKCYRTQETGGDLEILQPALAALYEKGTRAKILAGVGLCVAAFLAALGFLSSSGSTLSASLQTVSCAGCAPSSRFMDAAPYVIGGGSAAIAAFSELRKPESGSSRSASFSSNDAVGYPSTVVDSQTSNLATSNSKNKGTNKNLIQKIVEFFSGFRSGKNSIGTSLNRYKEGRQKRWDIFHEITENSSIDESQESEYRKAHEDYHKGAEDYLRSSGKIGQTVTSTAPTAAAAGGGSIIKGVWEWIIRAFPAEEAGKWTAEQQNETSNQEEGQK